MSPSVFDKLLGFLDKTDPTKSLKHLTFAVGMGCASLWLTIGLFLKTGLDGNWVLAFGIFMTAITGAKVWTDKPGSAVSTDPGMTTVLQPGETEVKKGDK